MGLINDILYYLAGKQYSGYENGVNISTYTQTNQYTVPYDGIVTASCAYQAGSYVQVYVDGGVMLQASSTVNTGGGLVGSQTFALPVFKGQKLYCARESSARSTAAYRPFKSIT